MYILRAQIYYFFKKGDMKMCEIPSACGRRYLMALLNEDQTNL